MAYQAYFMAYQGLYSLDFTAVFACNDDDNGDDDDELYLNYKVSIHLQCFSMNPYIYKN